MVPIAYHGVDRDRRIESQKKGNRDHRRQRPSGDRDKEQTSGSGNKERHDRPAGRRKAKLPPYKPKA
jgi:hypothetical protein